VLVVLAFALLLLFATLVSELAGRSVLSLTVLFLGGGVIAGNTGLLAPVATDPLLLNWTEASLFFMLFLEGMQLSFRDVSRPGHWPGRALGIGLPVTTAIIALLAHWILPMDWMQAFLLGALLSPTDPVLTSAIIGNNALPEKLRHFLRVESGLNDGLALPLVFVLLRMLKTRSLSIGGLIVQIVGGLVAGGGLVWLAVALARGSAFKVSRKYESLFITATGLLVYSATSLTGLNSFLAAYSAGLGLTTLSERAQRVFTPFGEAIAELLKLSGIFLFGTLLRPDAVHWSGKSLWFAIAVLCVPRPVALSLSLIRSGISSSEFWTAAWFGPRGFASMLYAIYVLLAGVPQGNLVFYGAAMVIVLSTVAHSSTDVPVAKWFAKRQNSEQRSP
jgi:NhaP-type Na+/H+ or K+/H+ antiporter